MKLTIPQLKSKLNNKIISGAYLFYGEETFILNSYIDIMKATCVTDFPEFNYMEFNEENCDVESLIGFVMAYTQFSDKKLIVAKNTGILQNNSYKDKLVSLIEQIPDFTVLVFVEETTAKIHKDILSAFEKYGNMTDFIKQDPATLRTWVNKKFISAGKKMSIENMTMLVDMCGHSLEKLSVECGKLIASTEEEVISREIIDRLVTVPAEYKIFAMSDHLLNKNATEAYGLLKEFKTNKEQPTEIIALVYASVSEIYMFKSLMAEGGNPENYLAPNRKWLGKKYRMMANKHDFKKLRTIMGLCYEYDEKIKIGEIDQYTALELIMAQMLI